MKHKERMSLLCFSCLFGYNEKDLRRFLELGGFWNLEYDSKTDTVLNLH